MDYRSTKSAERPPVGENVLIRVLIEDKYFYSTATYVGEDRFLEKSSGNVFDGRFLLWWSYLEEVPPDSFKRVDEKKEILSNSELSFSVRRLERMVLFLLDVRGTEIPEELK